jgi:hypothetical protein
MSAEESKRKTERKGHTVLMTVPDELMERLRKEARERTVPIATAARQLVKERLDQLNGHGR